MKTIFLSAVLAAAFSFSSCSNDGNVIQESGTIEATEVVISSQVAERVQKIYKDEGAQVAAGDTILKINTETLQLQYRQAEATRDIAKAQYTMAVKGARKEDIAQAEAAVQQAEANLSVVQSDSERMENLYKSQSITKQQYDNAMAKFDVARSQYRAAYEALTKTKHFSRPEEIEQARANYAKAQAAMELIEKSLRDCYVTSPINGFVVKKFVEEGESVTMMTSLVKVADLSNVDLSIYISETDLGKVKLGQKAEVTVDAFPKRIFDGKVIFISPEAEFTPKNIQTKDERTKLVFEVKIRVANPGYELKSGLPADAKIIL